MQASLGLYDCIVCDRELCDICPLAAGAEDALQEIVCTWLQDHARAEQINRMSVEELEILAAEDRQFTLDRELEAQFARNTY